MNELEIISHRQIAGLSMFINTVDYRTAHMHSEWELILVLDQPLAVISGGSSFAAEPGQMVLLSPNEPHEFRRIEESATFLCLQVSPELLPVRPQTISDEKLPHKYLSDEDMQAVLRKLRDMMKAYLDRGENHELYCVGICCLVFYELFRKLPTHVLTVEEAAAIGRRNARLKRLLRFVDENYMHKIRLSDFAKEEGCSMTYLSHFVKDTMNQTFQEYVASVRFNRACELILAGERKLLNVCMESGFSDYRYFSRAFRQRCGMTPEGYAKSALAVRPKSEKVHRSLHSMERFYTREESLTLLEKY